MYVNCSPVRCDLHLVMYAGAYSTSNEVCLTKGELILVIADVTSLVYCEMMAASYVFAIRVQMLKNPEKNLPEKKIRNGKKKVPFFEKLRI